MSVGWVHSVCFSGDGTRLAWVGHDSSICVADAQQGQAITFVRTRYLPFLSCLWISPTRLLVSGYDCCPMVYEYSKDQITFVDKLDKSQRKEVDGVSDNEVASGSGQHSSPDDDPEVISPAAYVSKSCVFRKSLLIHEAHLIMLE
ncbi:hypothetical protein MRX96_000813 [Rhipicephalus microplus]